MNKKIFALLLLSSSVCTAETQGIESANVETSFGYRNSNYYDSYTLDVTANLPVSGKLASNVSAMYQNSNGKEFKGGRGFDSTITGIYATLFLSDQSIGKAGTIFTYAKSKHDYPASLASFKNQESKGYGIFGVYYLNNSSIAANRNYSEINNDSSIYTSSFSLAYYVLANTGIAISGFRVDQETDYRFTLTHQPSFLNNSAAVTLSYNRDSEDRDFDSYIIYFDYYFGIRASLIERDRRYR